MRTIFLSAALLFQILFSFAYAQVSRTPIYEVFSSSTCGPCYGANEKLKSLLSTKPADEYVLVKFQQYFPGTGDPYCTAEGRNRFLGLHNLGASIVAVPQLNIDGNEHFPFSYLGDSIYNYHRSVPATFKLSGTYSVSGKTVSAKIKYTPLTPGGSIIKLFVAVIETETSNNAKTNGETKFYNVMKKMLPAGGGTDIANAPLNVEDSVSLTYTFNGSYRLPIDGQDANNIDHPIEHSVENFSNLRVVAWVQGVEGSAYPVYQAANLVLENSLGVGRGPHAFDGIKIFPNPASQKINVELAAATTEFVSLSIYSLSGKEIKTQLLRTQAGKAECISLDLHDVAPGLYNLIITDPKKNAHSEMISVMQ